MPIEISELIVRATVNETPSDPETKQRKNNTNRAAQSDAAATEVRRSVDALLDVLKRKNER